MSRGLCLKCECTACMYCVSGQKGHFQSQIVLSQLPSFVVQPNNPSMLCDRFVGVLRTHSSNGFVTAQLVTTFAVILPKKHS